MGPPTIDRVAKLTMMEVGKSRDFHKYVVSIVNQHNYFLVIKNENLLCENTNVRTRHPNL